MQETMVKQFTPEDLPKRLNGITQKAINDGLIAGAVVMVSHKNHLIYQQATGLRHREKGIPMTMDTIFLYASLTKPIVTAVVMRLVEDNVLSLNDDITQWLPEFLPRLEDQTVPHITIHHLLTHTAGFNYGFWEPLGEGAYHNARVSDGFNQLGVSFEQQLHRLMQVPLLFKPGSSWRYSVGLDVLGAVIEKATSKTLPELVQQYITQPLGLNDMGFTVTDRERFFTPYYKHPHGLVPMGDFAQVPLPPEWGDGVVSFATQRIFDHASYPSGGAGMAGTAPDFMKFLSSMPQLLKMSTLQKMMALQVDETAQTQGEGWGFGYGWAVLDDPQPTQTPQSKGTIQWGGVYGHNWFIDPVREITAVVLTNTAIEGMTGRYPTQMRDAIYDGIPH